MKGNFVDFIKHIVILAVIFIVGMVLLYWLSPDDVIGAVSDVGLKIFWLAVKAITFTLGLKFLFGFLDFKKVFSDAGESTALGLKAVATAIIIFAWALVVFPF